MANSTERQLACKRPTVQCGTLCKYRSVILNCEIELCTLNRFTCRFSLYGFPAIAGSCPYMIQRYLGYGFISCVIYTVPATGPAKICSDLGSAFWISNPEHSFIMQCRQNISQYPAELIHIYCKNKCKVDPPAL